MSARSRNPLVIVSGEIAALANTMSRFLAAGHKRGLLVVSIWAFATSVLEMAVAGAALAYVQCLTSGCAAVVDRGVAPTGLPEVPAISLGLFALIVLKLAVQAGFHWRQIRFVQTVQKDTLRRLLEGYFHLDWQTFRARNNAHYFRRCATTAIDAAYVSHQCATLIAASLTVLFLSALTLGLYPLLSLALGGIFLVIIVVTHMGISRVQKRSARSREAALQALNMGFAEAFSAFRELRVYRLEDFIQGTLDASIGQLESTNRRLDFLPVLPRIVIDFAIFAMVLAVVTAWIAFNRPIEDLLPMLVFFAVVARSILPAMTNLLSIWAQIYGSVINIELMLEEFDRNAEGRIEAIGVRPHPADTPAFALQGVSFRHGDNLPAILDDASLSIAHPSWVALTGPSGTGKTTVMELLCGILEPQEGRILHDWPAAPLAPRVAYVPQHVALLDATVLENIVFGFDDGDEKRAIQALEHAQLLDTINRLDAGLMARVGAEGSRLSGGERQRLAVARALYRRPDLMLLDEATSGLDEATENAALSAIRSAYPTMTVVYITHRQANLRFADAVTRLENGKIEILPRAGATS